MYLHEVALRLAIHHETLIVRFMYETSAHALQTPVGFIMSTPQSLQRKDLSWQALTECSLGSYSTD
jgi:hypothetical protein